MKAHYSIEESEPITDSNHNYFSNYQSNPFVRGQMDGVIGVNPDGNFEYLEINPESELDVFIWELLLEENASINAEFEVLERKIPYQNPKRENKDIESRFNLKDYVLEEGLTGERWRWVNSDIAEKIERRDLIEHGIPEDLLFENHPIHRWHDRTEDEKTTLDLYQAFQKSSYKFPLPEPLNNNGISYGKYHDETDLVFVLNEGNVATIYKGEWVREELSSPDEEFEIMEA